MRGFARLPLLALPLAVWTCRSDSPSLSQTSTFSLVDEVDTADVEFDEQVFRSVRKDGRLTDAVTIDGRTELSLTPPVPSRIRYRLWIPEKPVLRFAAAAATAGDDALAAALEMSLKLETVDGEETVVIEELIRRRAANQWRDLDIDLSPWAGQEVSLTLATDWRSPREIGQPVLASWGHPVVADATAEYERPHLLLVSIDCLRADHVGAYGYERDTTPNLDELAADGTVFENAFATASWTLPTHMSMLTGLLPSFHGATKWEKLSSSIDYLPELLGEAGYRTSGVVSWVYLSQTYGFERGFHSYQVLDDPEASDVVDRALVELDRGAGQLQFLFVHLYDPHWPYLPPDDLLTRFGERPRDISDLLEITSKQEPPADELAIEEVVRLYDAEIAFADRELGRLFTALEERGLYDDFLIVVTADHGEAFHEHDHWQHSATLYDEITHVPLIVKWPGAAESRNEKPWGASRRSAAPSSQVDIFATMLEHAGIPSPEAESPDPLLVRRVLTGEDQSASDRIVVSEVTFRSPAGTFLKIALRQADRKYVATLSGPTGDDLGVNSVDDEELYDLVADPLERRNLLENGGEDGRSLASPFRAALRSFLDAAKAARALRQGEAVELDDATIEKLRSLGYTY
jgi:arylsulfatase A-like enzyme